MSDPRTAAFFRDLGPADRLPIDVVKPSPLAAKTPAPTRSAQYNRDRRTQQRDGAARRTPEGRLRRYGITLTTVHEYPVEWARRIGMPFCGDAS